MVPAAGHIKIYSRPSKFTLYLPKQSFYKLLFRSFTLVGRLPMITRLLEKPGRLKITRLLRIIRITKITKDS